MRVIPVLDLLGGLVVRGMGGARENYRPIVSRYAANAEPLTVIRAFRETFGFEEFYVADLDAIMRARPSKTLDGTTPRPPSAPMPLSCGLPPSAFRRASTLLVDAGVHDVTSAAAVLDAGAKAVIAGLETLPGPECLAALCREFGPQRVLFSLDLKQGTPLVPTVSWSSPEPSAIAAEAVRLGIDRLIVLDLAAVGLGAGVPTLPLCRQLRASFPSLELITGGGVRSVDDLAALREIGVDGVLVASALHDGRITPADVEALRRKPTGRG